MKYSFLEAITEIEPTLSSLLFVKSSYLKKGYAHFVEFTNKELKVEFIYGPSDYDIEMFITISKNKMAFKDLLEIPLVAKWVEENRYIPQNGPRNIKDELLWFIKLLEFFLKFIK